MLGILFVVTPGLQNHIQNSVYNPRRSLRVSTVGGEMERSMIMENGRHGECNDKSNRE